MMNNILWLNKFIIEFHVWFNINKIKLKIKRKQSHEHLNWYHISKTGCMLSYVWLFCNPLDYSCQAPLSMRFFRQEHWSRLLFPHPGDLIKPGIEPTSPALQADCLQLSHQGRPHLMKSSTNSWFKRKKENKQRTNKMWVKNKCTS